MLNRWRAVNVTGWLVIMFLSTFLYFHSNYKSDPWNVMFSVEVLLNSGSLHEKFWKSAIDFKRNQISFDSESLRTIVLCCNSQILYLKYMMQFTLCGSYKVEENSGV